MRWDVHCVERTGSTNSDLIALARAGAPIGRVVRAGHQTAGRGRLGRIWEAPPGSSLLASILLAAEPVPFVTMARVALAASDACSSLAGVEAALKWPNDLLVGHDKLAGLLAEADAGSPWVVVGIGCNVLWPPPVQAGVDEPAGSGGTTEPAGSGGRTEPAGSGGRTEPAGSGGTTEPGGRATAVTSLARHAADVPSPADLLAGLLDRLDGWVSSSPEAVLAAYRGRCSTLGQEVKVTGPRRTIQGRAIGITPSGELEVADGVAREVVRVGDVVHVRARWADP